MIQSNITMPDKKWLKSEFLNMVPEGKAAFDSAWNELKNNGYLHVHTYSNGKSFTYEYELLNEPVDGPHTFYYNSKGELSSTNLDRAAKKMKVKRGFRWGNFGRNQGKSRGSPIYRFPVYRKPGYRKPGKRKPV